MEKHLQYSIDDIEVGILICFNEVQPLNEFHPNFFKIDGNSTFVIDVNPPKKPSSASSESSTSETDENQF